MRRTIVVIRTQEEGRAWCARAGIKPYSRNTTIASRPVHLQGLIIRPEDRVIYVPSERLVPEPLVDAVRRSLVKGARS